MDEQSIRHYADFLTLLGHKVIRTKKIMWLNVRPGVFQPAAPFQIHEVTRADLSEVLHHGRAIACRWFSENEALPLDHNSAGPIVYNAQPPYDMSSLHQKARNQTRRALERITVKRMELTDALEPQCYRVYADNVRRLGLFQKESQIRRRWRSWAAAIKGAECAELWTAWDETDLVALTVAVRTPWGTELVLQRSAGYALGLCPNNALVYEVTREAFSREARVVSFGLSSFSASGNGLDHFKQNMGFRAVPLRERYQWNVLFKPFVSFLTPSRLRAMYNLVSRVTS